MQDKEPDGTDWEPEVLFFLLCYDIYTSPVIKYSLK